MYRSLGSLQYPGGLPYKFAVLGKKLYSTQQRFPLGGGGGGGGVNCMSTTSLFLCLNQKTVVSTPSIHVATIELSMCAGSVPLTQLH